MPKSPRTDGIKPELFKLLIDNQTCIKTLTKIFEDILQNGDVPQEWKVSKKKIPKTTKPTAKDPRPIALFKYLKIFTGILKTKILKHLKI